MWHDSLTELLPDYLNEWEKRHCCFGDAGSAGAAGSSGEDPSDATDDQAAEAAAADAAAADAAAADAAADPDMDPSDPLGTPGMGFGPPGMGTPGAPGIGMDPTNPNDIGVYGLNKDNELAFYGYQSQVGPNPGYGVGAFGNFANANPPGSLHTQTDPAVTASTMFSQTNPAKTAELAPEVHEKAFDTPDFFSTVDPTTGLSAEIMGMLGMDPDEMVDDLSMNMTPAELSMAVNHDMVAMAYGLDPSKSLAHQQSKRGISDLDPNLDLDPLSLQTLAANVVGKAHETNDLSSAIAGLFGFHDFVDYDEIGLPEVQTDFNAFDMPAVDLALSLVAPQLGVVKGLANNIAKGRPATTALSALSVAHPAFATANLVNNMADFFTDKNIDTALNTEFPGVTSKSTPAPPGSFNAELAELMDMPADIARSAFDAVSDIDMPNFMSNLTDMMPETDLASDFGFTTDTSPTTTSSGFGTGSGSEDWFAQLGNNLTFSNPASVTEQLAGVVDPVDNPTNPFAARTQLGPFDLFNTQPKRYFA